MAEGRVERRLAAILAGDVASYGRLMGADEEGTLSRLNAHRREFLEPKIADHRGRIVKRTGDGVLIEFASAVDAVRCSVEIQHGMAERNASVPQDERIELRIGIHVGDVIIEDGDIFGDGLNIAARLEGTAQPGGICISDDAYRQVRGKIDAIFEDTGGHELKNIARPVRVFALFLGSAILAYAGDAERAIDWGERALRISPNDRLAYVPYHVMAIAHFLRGRYEEAENCARRAVQYNPGFSFPHCILAAALVKLGRTEDAKRTAIEVLALQPSFSSSGFCTALAVTPALSESLTKAWLEAGLPP